MGQCFGRCHRSSSIQPTSHKQHQAWTKNGSGIAKNMTQSMVDSNPEQCQVWTKDGIDVESQANNTNQSTVDSNHERCQAWTEDSNGIEFQAKNLNSVVHVGRDSEDRNKSSVRDHSMLLEVLSNNNSIQPCDDIDSGQAMAESSCQGLCQPVPAHGCGDHSEQISPTGEEKLHTSSTFPTDTINQRVMLTPPDDFDRFIRETVVPTFEGQRHSYQKQFAVLLLVTEEDFKVNKMKFYPQPLTDNKRLSMPSSKEDYHNYIVARPLNDNRHSEAVILDELDKVWNGFMSHNDNNPPKCFILYSWNVPCSKCTDLIIRSFNRPLYKSVSVIIATTAYWDGETHETRNQNVNRMKQEQMYVGSYRGIQLPGSGFNNINYSDSDEYSNESYDEYCY